MPGRRLISVLLLIAVVALAVWLWLRPEPRPVSGAKTGTSSLATAPSTPPPTPVPAPPAPAPREAAPAAEAEQSQLAADLNATDGSIHRDFVILEEILQTWRTNFRGAGNPVGDNVEITAALTGRNDFGVALIPREHPAVNARGQLCDRWGTPFFFHQLAADRMEIRSAGPDRELYTADDAVFTPEGEEPLVR